MKRVIMVVWMIGGVGCLTIALAQVTTTAVPFLMIAPNSRASGMGEAGVALGDDVWATYWNPAGYAFQEGSEIGLNYAKWQPEFGLDDQWIAHTVYKQHIEQLSGTVSAGFTYLNQGDIARTESDPTPLETFKSYEWALTAGYATRLSDVLGIGFNIRFISSVLSPVGSSQVPGKGVASGFSFDVGLLYKPLTFYIPFVSRNFGERLRLGFNLSNIGPKMTYVDKALADPLPMNLRLGFSFKCLKTKYNSINFLADFNKLLVKRNNVGSDEFYEAIFTSWTKRPVGELIRDFTTGLGIEYWYGAPALFALRGGYFYEDPRNGNRKFFTFGGGVRLDAYGFDFSYIAASEKDHPLGGTLRFSLLVLWGFTPS